MKFVLLFMILLSLALLACEDEDIIDIYTPISGTVLDSITMQPIDSARIYLRDTVSIESAFTDSTGYFETSIFGINVPVIYCLKDGYKSKQISGATIGSNGAVENLLFLMGK